MELGTARGDTFRFGSLTILGVATAIVGVAAFLYGVGIGWGVAVLLLAVGIIASALSQGAALHVMPVLFGIALFIVGGFAYGAGRHGYGVACFILGLATVAVMAAARYMRTHPARAPRKFTERYP